MINPHSKDNLNHPEAVIATGNYKKGEIVEVKLLDLGDKNQCYGQLQDGMSVFAQGPCAVGDTVKAVILKVKKRFLVSRMIEVVEPSPHRVEPQCAHFGVCGGCKWQHLKYTEQLRLKQKQVRDALERIGKFRSPEIASCLPASELFGYRNKLVFSFGDNRSLTSKSANSRNERGFALGFHSSGNHAAVVNIDSCDIASEEMNIALKTTRTFCLKHKKRLPVYSSRSRVGELRKLILRKGEYTGEFMVNIVTSTWQPKLMKEFSETLQSALGGRLTTFVNNVSETRRVTAVGNREFTVYGPGYITDKLGEYVYRISANSFFQTNTVQAERLYLQILESARLKREDVVYDLYCGTGSITLFIARHCRKVLAVEAAESSVLDARENARRHGIENCSFIKLDLRNIKNIQGKMRSFGKPNIIITDPPRTGMHSETVQTLLKIAPEIIIYVSCNPAFLARDGQMLCGNGDYKLTHVQPVDMFPQTNHIESIARFERAD